MKTDVEGVPGAFVLSHVLDEAECEQILQLSLAMGYTEDAPVSLGRSVRGNANCVWIADASLHDPLWRRVAAHMPPNVGGGRPLGLSNRWRLYRYGPDDVFKLHADGSWPGSALNGSGMLVKDAYEDRWSQLTCVHPPTLFLS